MTTREALLQSGQNLKQIRNAKGFTIDTLAVLSGVDVAMINACESGDFDFPLSVIFELAAALNIDFRQILVDPKRYNLR